MKYNPKIHKRRSIRLKGYDYSQAGLYFITICCQNRTHFYGKIIDGKMILNDAGKMIEKEWLAIKERFHNIEFDEFIIMPNHFHAILNIVEMDGDDPKTTVETNVDDPKTTVETNVVDPKTTVGSTLVVDLLIDPIKGQGQGQPQGIAPTIAPAIAPTTVGDIIGAFKSITTNEYIKNVKSNDWKRFDGRLWQRNYWEHIIRNEKAYHNISEYIKSNPLNWKEDSLH